MREFENGNQWRLAMAATHEAGHAVMAVCCGELFKSVCATESERAITFGTGFGSARAKRLVLAAGAVATHPEHPLDELLRKAPCSGLESDFFRLYDEAVQEGHHPRKKARVLIARYCHEPDQFKGNILLESLLEGFLASTNEKGETRRWLSGVAPTYKRGCAMKRVVRYCDEAREILAKPNVRSAIQVLADAMVAQGSISYDQVLKLCNESGVGDDAGLNTP